MENEAKDNQDRPRAEWGSLTGWETIVFQLEDDLEKAECRKQKAEDSPSAADLLPSAL